MQRPRSPVSSTRTSGESKAEEDDDDQEQEIIPVKVVQPKPVHISLGDDDEEDSANAQLETYLKQVNIIDWATGVVRPFLIVCIGQLQFDFKCSRSDIALSFEFVSMIVAHALRLFDPSPCQGVNGSNQLAV